MRTGHLLVPVLLVLSLVLSACSGGGASQKADSGGSVAPAAKPEKITAIISENFLGFMDAFGKEWTQKTGVKVELISQDYNSTYTKIVSALAGGSPVDIVAVDSIWTAGFAKAGFLRPLDDQTRPFADQLVPVAINQRKVGGKVYSMPVTNEAKFLYYNEELLKKGGYSAPPKTWEELVAMGKDLQKKGITKYGITWGWSQAEGLMCDYVALVNDFGGKIQDDNGNWLFNQGGGVKALQFMVDTLKDGVSDPASVTLNDRQVVNTFAAGDAPFLLSWSFALSAANDAKDSKVAGHVRVGLIPGVQANNTVSSSVTGGSGLAVSATSKNADLAWDYIKYVTDRQQQVNMFKIRSNMPVWKTLYDDATVKQAYPYVKDMEKQFDYAVWRPNLPKYTEWSGILQVEIHKALTGEKSPQQALDDATKAVANLK